MINNAHYDAHSADVLHSYTYGTMFFFIFCPPSGEYSE